MADAPIIEINTIEYETAMRKLRDGVRMGFVDFSYGTLTVQSRLLAERCQTFTPPANVAQGSAAVIRDLTRIYFPVSERTFKNKRVRQIIRGDIRDAWDKLAQNFSDVHGLRNTKAIGFSESFHQQNRLSRGRARGLANGRRGAKKHLGVVTLGPEATAARAYMKKVKARVGWAKAGWNRAIIALGGSVSAGWIDRHGMERGQLIDGRNDADNPFIQVRNNTGWAKYNGSEGERIIRNAISARSRDMASYADRMMRLAAERAQKGA